MWRSEWFFDEKFYIFIHWGIFSVPAWAPIGQASEWYLQYLLAGEPKIAHFQKENYGNNATVESYKASALHVYVRSGRYLICVLRRNLRGTSTPSYGTQTSGWSCSTKLALRV